MNIYYYLFYKVSQALNKKGNNELGPIAALTFFTFINIIVIYVNILPVSKENFNQGYKTGLLIIGIILFVTNSLLFLNKKRSKLIKNHYMNESPMSRMTGNFLVILYVVLTIGLIFVA